MNRQAQTFFCGTETYIKRFYQLKNYYIIKNFTKTSVKAGWIAATSMHSTNLNQLVLLKFHFFFIHSSNVRVCISFKRIKLLFFLLYHIKCCASTGQKISLHSYNFETKQFALNAIYIRWNRYLAIVSRFKVWSKVYRQQIQRLYDKCLSCGWDYVWQYWDSNPIKYDFTYWSWQIIRQNKHTVNWLSDRWSYF